MRGQAKRGFRMTAMRKALGITNQQQLDDYRAKVSRGEAPPEHIAYELTLKGQKVEALQTPALPEKVESDDEIGKRIAERFRYLQMLAEGATQGGTRALIVSGPPGVGKSHCVETVLKGWDPDGDNHTIEKGVISPTGLFRQLWAHSKPGKVLVFDDADSVFLNESSLALLKAACDSSDNRVISWRSDYFDNRGGGSRSDDDDEDGEGDIPQKFDFHGSVIFITNYDFDYMIARGNRMAPHFEALQSRAQYMDLTMKTQRDKFVRIKQVVEQGALDSRKLNKVQKTEIVKWIEENLDNLRELSVRVVLKVADNMLTTKDWKVLSKITCCKN